MIEQEPHHTPESSVADEDRKKESAKLARYIDWTKRHLETWLGVGNLSHIEEYRLRKILEQCLREYERDDVDVKKLLGEIEIEKQAGADPSVLNRLYERVSNLSLSSINTEREAVFRWLWELYGIHAQDIPRVNILKDCNTGEILYQELAKYTEDLRIAIIDSPQEKLRKERRLTKIKEEGERSLLKKAVALGKTEDEVYTVLGFPDDFKEYLRRLRERSHLI